MFKSGRKITKIILNIFKKVEEIKKICVLLNMFLHIYEITNKS